MGNRRDLLGSLLVTWLGRPQGKTQRTEYQEYVNRELRNKDVTATSFGLVSSPDFDIITDISETKTNIGITKEDVRTWVEAELARSAPQAKIEKRPTKPDMGGATVFAILDNWDKYTRTLVVTLSLMDQTSTGGVVYSISIEFIRTSLIVGGLQTRCTTWEKGSFGYLGKSVYRPDYFRDAVKSLTREFADAWVIANKNKLLEESSQKIDVQ